MQGTNHPLCNAKPWCRLILRLDFTQVFKTSMEISEADEEGTPARANRLVMKSTDTRNSETA